MATTILFDVIASFVSTTPTCDTRWRRRAKSKMALNTRPYHILAGGEKRDPSCPCLLYAFAPGVGVLPLTVHSFIISDDLNKTRISNQHEPPVHPRSSAPSRSRPPDEIKQESKSDGHSHQSAASLQLCNKRLHVTMAITGHYIYYHHLVHRHHEEQVKKSLPVGRR